MELKVGDLVLLTTDKRRCCGWNESGEMDKFLGTIQRIGHIVEASSSFNIEKYDDDFDPYWFFREENVECVVDDTSKDYPKVEPYNFYVKCVFSLLEKSHEGKIFHVKDGKIDMYGNGLTVPIESDYRLKDIQDVNDYFNMNVKKGIRNKESNHDYDVMFFAYATYEDLTLNVVDKPRIIDAEFIEKQEKEIKEPTFREHPLIQEFDSIFHSAFFKEDDEK